ncbi:hypothetical protein HJFPF1_04629 [Paramyrothecium foliicola]|nr:hypothetical protein HJFPF1_04629 [Paramyrothecium foliicola]
MARYAEPRYYTPSSVQYSYIAYDSSPTYAPLSSPTTSMYRYGSSDGSSYTMSTPTSPAPDHHAYTFQEEAQYYSDYQQGDHTSVSTYQSTAGAEYASLETVEEEQAESAQQQRDHPVMCLFPGCDKMFRRRADLDRHYRHRHCPDNSKESYRCDYQRCVRRREPFHRRDHYRDHLRDFHKEDIGKRNVNTNEEWFRDRNISPLWWRCHKCLSRISVSQFQWDCPTCKISCEQERRTIRQRC